MVQLRWNEALAQSARPKRKGSRPTYIRYVEIYEGPKIGVSYWGPCYKGCLLFGVYCRGPLFSYTPHTCISKYTHAHADSMRDEHARTSRWLDFKTATDLLVRRSFLLRFLFIGCRSRTYVQGWSVPIQRWRHSGLPAAGSPLSREYAWKRG